MVSQSAHFVKVYELWKRSQQRTKAGSYEIDGENLHIADVVATSKHGCKPKLSKDPKISQALQESVDVLFDHLAKGWYVYGVNTGFGGSADSRTTEVINLQKSLMQLTQTGILSTSSDGSKPEHSMPVSWVRAAMVIRCNSTLRGHSAVSIPIVNALLDLLDHQLTPVVPLRGSVSASGDLMPLAYVAGSIEGNPDIYLEQKDGQVLPSNEALSDAGLSPVVLGPKEGLGLVNGTSSAAGLGALVMAEAHHLALLTQVLTGAAVEALRGSSESFHPFIAQTRPHPGQIECARNIHYFLRGSHLSRDVLEPKNRRREDLAQDRYALRGSPQWIGPQLEDLLLADQQISIELNSTCDNPLVDRSTNDILYGCNFMASSVCSAMEKVRISLQMLGRILFAQTTEMIDPHLSGGLPTNLAADDPSLSFTMKGVDINMAAYMAELSYLANPMSSHVQAAEMHNQSINSMGLASARMSDDANDILMKMCACHIYVSCQALDLRSLHTRFITEAEEVIALTTTTILSAKLKSTQLEGILIALRHHVGLSWNSTGKLDLLARCEALTTSAVPIIVAHSDLPSTQVVDWQDKTTKAVSTLWDEVFKSFCEKPHTAQLLGKGSKALYQYVRQDLGVPFHEGFIEHPTIDDQELHNRRKRTIGGWISVIHDSIKKGSLYNPLMVVASEGLMESLNSSNGVCKRAANGSNGTSNGHVHLSNGGGDHYTNGHASKKVR